MSRIDLGNNIKDPKTVPATVEGFYERTDSEHTGRICAELADFEESRLRGELDKSEYKSLKNKTKIDAFFYTPHAHFEKGYKSRENEPVDSGKAILDVDGNPNGREVYTQRVMGRERELGINMFNISISGTGFAVLFDIPEGLDRKQAQAWMAHELGDVVYDKGVHDVERAVYIPCREYILYIDEELMFGDELHPAVLKEEELRKYTGKEQKSQSQGQAQCIALPSKMDERVRFIAEGVMKAKELEPSDFLNEGGRHTTVKIFLSGATQLLDKSEINGVLQELMPDHWNDENIQKLVNDFYQNYTNPSQRLLKYQEQLFTQSQRMGMPSDAIGKKEEISVTPPEMPKKLPKLIALLTSKTPDIYKASVAHAVFPPLATHLCDVRFMYTDNTEHEATLMNVLMAGTGTGKGCIDKPVERIMADIERRDEENLRREAEWKKDCQKKGANKDKLLRPEGLVIQVIDPDMTKPALVTRMDEAEGHFVYVKLNELDLFEQLKGADGKQHFQLMCLAFDDKATYGQTRFGTQSVTARPICRFNWNACTTILKGRRFFKRVLTDGPISRINFCTIPEQEIGSPQPVYGIYDSEFDEALKPYIDNLVAARGMIDCHQAYRLAKKLQAECADFARLSQSEVYWNLSHRACLIAYLKACVLYVANGQKWEKTIEEFIRWSLNYDLWCKMQFFGAAIEYATNGEDSRMGTRGPRNLLEMLPDEFTLEDAKRVRRQQGMDTVNTAKMVRNWKSRGYVTQISDISFKKAMYKNGDKSYEGS